jgi:acyl-CoA thioester hydrolase
MEQCADMSAPDSTTSTTAATAPNATTAQHRPGPQARSAYRHFSSISTRWMDNDAYGHINNVVYYSYFDTVVNRYLIEAGVLDVQRGSVIGLVVETHCNYFSPLSFPQTVDTGLRVARLGATSVRYEIGLFGGGAELTAACGHFIHVYVDRETRRPSPLPPALIQTLQGLM